MPLFLNYAVRSDRGLVRSNNEDSVYAGPRLLALADGMGGHAAGEVASRVVIGALAPLDEDEPGDNILDQLRDATLAGNQAISDMVDEDPELEGMGTTLTAILFSESRLGMVHVGDSRGYLYRDGTLAQITRDDTFVQSLIDEGRITPEEANVHPQRSLVLKALTGQEVDPSLTMREARAGDRYMICSDGLSDMVSFDTLAEAMRTEKDPQDCVDRLIELALKAGGADNVTVIVADVVELAYGEDAPIIRGAAGEDGDDDPRPDSSAARAAATRPQQPKSVRSDPIAPPADGPPRRRWVRPLLVASVLLVVLVAAGLVGRWWVLSNYFIGVNAANEVVIFQGLPDRVIGFPMNRQVEDSCPAGSAKSCEPVEIKDLQEAERAGVHNGVISADSLEGAREAMQRLRNTALLPACSELEPKPKPPESTTTAPPPGPGEPAPPPPDASESATPLEPREQKPGVNCRAS